MKLFRCINPLFGLVILALSLLASAQVFAQSCPAGTSPVYRFYNLVAYGHFFTMSESEKNTVLAYPSFRYEGIGFCAYPAQVIDGCTSCPNGGLWSGSIIQFYVSSSGTQITSTGSSLRASNGTPVAYILGPVPVSGCASYSSVRYSIAGTTPISNGSFTSNATISSGETLTLNGSFSSSTSSSGGYSIGGYDSQYGCSPRGSGSWSATATSRAAAMPLETSPANAPSQVRELFDAKTGEYIGTMEIYQ